ncbi:MAG: response regulator [Verrucomicrobiales bacterium]|nr:response regulator [Verrucomicrobiales bacterium]
MFTILHVDDDENDLLLLKNAAQMTQLPVKIVTTSDGDEAINYLTGTGIHADRDHYPLPSLVLLDLKMPRKNGFEVLEWIRSQPDLKRLPVVVFTSSRHGEDMNLGYDRGANSYLIKPVMLDELIELVKGLAHYWGHLNKTASEGRGGEPT